MKAFSFLLLLLLCGCASSQAHRPTLWLNESDVVVAPGASLVLHFNAPDSPGGRPALWLAARIVFVMEERVAPCLVIKVNGRDVGGVRLATGDSRCRFPCDPTWPTRSYPLCSQANGMSQWLVRFDNNSTIGEADLTAWRRQYASDGLPPSYLLDLTGLIHPGNNTLELTNTLDGKAVQRSSDLTFPDGAKPPYFSLQADFVRAGVINDVAVAEWNTAHIKAFDPRLRTFNVCDAEGFRDMEQYYGKAAAQPETPPELRSLMRLAHACFNIWKGEYPSAVALLNAMRADAPNAADVPQSLFLSSVALARQGNTAEAALRWGELRKMFPASSWTELAGREEAIISWKGGPAPVNWPALEAVRSEIPVTVDGIPDDPVWRMAPVATEFSLYPTGHRRPAVRTEARAAYDNRYLYLSIVSFEPFINEIRNPHRARDSAVWYDDNVEWFLDPGRTYTQVYEFELGVEGGIVDCRNVWQISFMQYDPPRVDKVSRQSDRWTAETAITWESLGVAPPKPGDIWLFNVVRTRPASANRPGECMTLGPATVRYAAPESAAWLIFR